MTDDDRFRGIVRYATKWEREAVSLIVSNAGKVRSIGRGHSANAIPVTFDVAGETIYVPKQPCRACLSYLSNAGIVRIVIV